MRLLATIPHPNMSITIFQINDKYIVKLEAGPMEQTFKFTNEEVNGADEIKKILDDEFMRNVIERFNEMFISLKEARERFEQSSKNV